MGDLEKPLQINYPVFLIGEHQKKAIIVEANNSKWFLLYATKELAELYIAQTGASLVIIEVSDIILQAFLKAGPHISGFVWNGLPNSKSTAFLDRSDF